MPLYLGIVALRNFLYRKGLMRSSEFDMPIICVGNLTTGGTGKTPHTEYLVRLLVEHHISTATLSRGYGRRTKGYLEIDTNMSALEAGDEPLQYKRKFKEQATIHVDGNRVRGILHVLHDHPDTGCIVLDDAFQHRAVKAGMNIVLTEYNHPFFKDYPLPVGDLREFRSGVKRADIVMVTKCPESPDKEEFISRISQYTDAPVFFSRITYGQITALQGNHEQIEQALLVTGIARPEPLYQFISSKAHIAQHLKYRDHYRFRPHDFRKIRKIMSTFSSSSAGIITSEKDAMRMMNAEGFEELKDFPVCFQEILIDLGKDRERFHEMILDYVGSYQENS